MNFYISISNDLNDSNESVIFFFHTLQMSRRQPLDQILGRSVEDLKASPQGSGSPSGTPSTNDRAAAKRAELRRQEQERRRREAVCIPSDIDGMKFYRNSITDFVLLFFPCVDGGSNRHEYAK